MPPDIPPTQTPQVPPQTPVPPPVPPPPAPAIPPFNNPAAAPPPVQPNPKLKPVDMSLLNLFENDPNEQLIGQINKHFIGVVIIWVTTILIFAAVAVAAYGALRFMPELGGLDTTLVRRITTIFFGLLGFFILVGGYVASWVYRRSAIIVTSEKLVQLVQRNIFDRKVSQLSIGDVQDVTVHQKGILARIFKYGSLVVETAGEQENYVFNYVPYPYECSKEIVGAHERNLQLYGN